MFDSWLGYMKRKYKAGCNVSEYDLRTFSYIPTKANIKGGTRYEPEDIDDQHRVGICTAISMTMNAQKVTGKKYSADFQYLIQKKYLDGNWDEGSTLFHALKAAHSFGLLPEEDWKFTDEDDRKLSYSNYIKKLQAISSEDIAELIKKADRPMTGYARVPTERDMLANAIDESKSGLISRFVVGKEWYTEPIEPLRRAVTPISGHAVTTTNYDGNSMRIANSWGSDWADGGTAYFLLHSNQPTEAWIPYYDKLPEVIEDQKPDNSKTVEEIQDKLFEVEKLLATIE